MKPETTIINRTYIPDVGEVLHNKGANSDWICRSVTITGLAVLENIESGWTLVAHGLCMYATGDVEWDYSTGGHFAERRAK